MTSGFRRKSDRVFSALKVHDAQAPSAGPWLTKDIGLGGMFVLAPDQWTAGQVVHLVIADDETQLEAVATVTHTDAEGAGLQFVEPTSTLRNKVIDLIRSRFETGEVRVERRSELRWKVEQLVQWRQGEQGHLAKVTDINPGGARVTALTIPELESELYFLLPVELPDEPGATTLMGCLAKVVHTSDDGFSVSFPEPSEAFRQAVMSFIASCAGVQAAR